MRVLLIALTPIATAGSLCFGFVPGLQNVAMVVYALRARGQTARFHSRGVLLSALSYCAWFPLFFAAAAVLPHESLGYVSAAGCASIVLAVILAPFTLFVAAHLTVPARGNEPGAPLIPMPDLDRALAQWDRLPWARRFGLLTFRVVPVVASFALFFVCRMWLTWGWSFFAASLAYGFGACAYAEAVASAHVLTRRPDEAPVASARYLFLPAAGCTLLAVVLFVYGVVAATDPSPMARYEGPFHDSSLPVPMHPALHPEGRPIQQTAILPGTDIRLRPYAGGVIIETADGGGAGRVSALSAHEEQPELLSDSTWVDERDDGFDIYQQQDGWRRVSIDRTGVRTDDGLARRLRHGLGSSALFLFGAGLLLIALSVWLMASAARVRRRLHSIQGVEELESPSCVGAIEGTFHGKAYNVSGVEGRTIIQVKGDCEVRAHFGGGLVRFRLPQGGTQSIGEPDDGQSVTLTGVFSRLGAQLRGADATWPGEALLIAGNKDRVAADLIQRALRPSLLVLLGANAAWVAALIGIVVHRL